MTAAQARALLLKLPGVEEGRSYGMPSFLVRGHFFARFRDEDMVLVLQLGAIVERDMLMQLAPDVFFFTEHYRNYPAVLMRLAEVPQAMLTQVLRDAHEVALAKPVRRKAAPRRARAKRT